MVEAFSRVVVPVLVPVIKSAPGVYVTINWDGRRLSICGVHGPRRNGDAWGSCGQCRDLLLKAGSTLGGGWSALMVAKLFDLWERWHLNDMRAGCEHQRAAWDCYGVVEVATWKLSSESLLACSEVRRRVEREIESTGRAEVSEAERGLLASPLRVVGPAEAPAPAGYVVERVESRAVGATYRREHPRGILCEPCDVCGYRYGSAWQFEAVPVEVLEWLRALPAGPAHPWGDVDTVTGPAAAGEGV